MADFPRLSLASALRTLFGATNSCARVNFFMIFAPDTTIEYNRGHLMASLLRSSGHGTRLRRCAAAFLCSQGLVGLDRLRRVGQLAVLDDITKPARVIHAAQMMLSGVIVGAVGDLLKQL
jgi:hypothetical protein